MAADHVGLGRVANLGVLRALATGDEAGQSGQKKTSTHGRVNPFSGFVDAGVVRDSATLSSESPRLLQRNRVRACCAGCRQRTSGGKIGRQVATSGGALPALGGAATAVLDVVLLALVGAMLADVGTDPANVLDELRPATNQGRQGPAKLRAILVEPNAVDHHRRVFTA
jgi:hypothetical protein